MSVRESWTFERAVLVDCVFEVDPANPHRIVGQIHLLDLDSDERRTISYGRPNLPGTFEEILRFRRAVHPERDSGAPVLAIEVAIESDRSMRFLSMRSRDG